MTKRFPIVAALIVALAVPAMTIPLSASDVQCRVPFSFSAGGKVLAPGLYRLSTQGGGMTITSPTDGAILMVNNALSRNRTDPKLVFEKYGDRYALREIWLGGTSGLEVIRTKAERKWLDMAALNTPVEIVVVPLN